MTVLKTKMISWSCSKCKVLFEDVILKDDSALFFAALWYMNMCHGEAIREQRHSPKSHSKADTHCVLSLASTLTINIYTRSYIIYIYIYNYLGVFNTDDWFINDLLCCVFQVCCEFSRMEGKSLRGLLWCTLLLLPKTWWTSFRKKRGLTGQF